VHHLALDVERFWFQTVVAGAPHAAEADGGTTSSWHVPSGMGADDVLALYRREIEQANKIIETTSSESGLHLGFRGAGDGNRTRTISLGSSTIAPGYGPELPFMAVWIDRGWI
jgi:hypothetical protein